MAFSEQGHPKQKTNTKQRLIEELEKEIENLKAEIKSNKTEIEALKLANVKPEHYRDNEKQANNVSKLNQELKSEKLISRTLEGHIDKPAEQLRQKMMTTTLGLLQANTDKLLTKANLSMLRCFSSQTNMK